MPKTHGAWIWYELMTADPAGAKAFYEAVVPGWTLQPGSEQTGGYGFIVNTDGGMTGGVLELTPGMTEEGCAPAWVGYVGVDDCDAAVASIEAAGGRCLMPARDVPMAGRIAMVADRDGAPFYVMTPTPPPGGGQSTAFSDQPHNGRCGWNELMAADPAGAVSFYTGQFGWSVAGEMDMGELGYYHFIAHDGGQMGAIFGLMPGMTQPVWAHYVWVPAINAAKAAIEAHGGQVVNGPMEVPGPLWIVQGVDPQGAFFSLVSEKA